MTVQRHAPVYSIGITTVKGKLQCEMLIFSCDITVARVMRQSQA